MRRIILEMRDCTTCTAIHVMVPTKRLPIGWGRDGAERRLSTKPDCGEVGLDNMNLILEAQKTVAEVLVLVEAAVTDGGGSGVVCAH